MKTISVPRSLLLNDLPVHPTKAAHRQAKRLTAWKKRLNEIKRGAIYKDRSSRAFATLHQDVKSVLKPKNDIVIPPFPTELGKFLAQRGISHDPDVLDSDLRAFVSLYKIWLTQDSLPHANPESLVRLAHQLVLLHKQRDEDIDKAVEIVLADETMTFFLLGEDNVHFALGLVAAEGLPYAPAVPKMLSLKEKRKLKSQYAHLPEYPITPYRPYSTLTGQRRIMAPGSTTDKLRRQDGIWAVGDLCEVLGQPNLPCFPPEWPRIHFVDSRTGVTRRFEMEEFAYCVRDEKAYEIVKAAARAGRELTPKQKAIVLESMYLF